MKADPLEDGISRGFLAVGDADWIENVVIPLVGSLDEVIPSHVGEIPVPLRQRMNRGISNSFVGIAIVGITLFVTKKIGDDFYEVFVKPRVRKCLESLDGKLNGGNRKKQKVFLSNMWYQKHNVVVTVAVTGKDFAEIASQLDLLGVVHTNALNWILDHGASAPVHYYRIQDGKVSPKPLLLKSVDEVTKL